MAGELNDFASVDASLGADDARGTRSVVVDETGDDDGDDTTLVVVVVVVAVVVARRSNCDSDALAVVVVSLDDDVEVDESDADFDRVTRGVVSVSAVDVVDVVDVDVDVAMVPCEARVISTSSLSFCTTHKTNKEETVNNNERRNTHMLRCVTNR